MSDPSNSVSISIDTSDVSASQSWRLELLDLRQDLAIMAKYMGHKDFKGESSTQIFVRASDDTYEWKRLADGLFDQIVKVRAYDAELDRKAQAPDGQAYNDIIDILGVTK